MFRLTNLLGSYPTKARRNAQNRGRSLRRSLGEVHSCGPYVARRWLRGAQSAARVSVHRAVRAGHDHHAECARRLGVCRGSRRSPLARVLCLSRYLRLFFIYLCGCFFLAFSQSERLELSRAQENTPKRQRRTWAKTRRLPDGSPLRMSPASASTMYMGTERVWSVRGLTIGSRLPHIWPSMTSDDL